MLNQPLKVWQALVLTAVVAAMSAGGTAIAVNGDAKSTTQGAGGYKYVTSDLKSNPTGEQSNDVAKCPRGYHVIGGGASTSEVWNAQQIQGSYPLDMNDGDDVPDDGWEVVVDNVGGSDRAFHVHAVCGK